jgi:hypothetical protein
LVKLQRTFRVTVCSHSPRPGDIGRPLRQYPEWPKKNN